MPFQIIRNDITKVKADAIVNTANPRPVIGSGTDGAIYEAAGAAQVLEKRREIGNIAPGEAAYTPAFDLPAKYIIHTVGPAWKDGQHGEQELLRSCYRNSLTLADSLSCESVAFPLIATGVYGFPKDKALAIAVAEISEFLLRHDMKVTLVVFDRKAFELSGKVFRGIDEYVDEHYVRRTREQEYRGEASTARRSGETARLEELARSRRMEQEAMFAGLDERSELPSTTASTANLSLDEVLSGAEKTFQQKLFELIDASGMDDVTVYKRANIDRKVFSTIRKKVDYRPKKRTALAFAIALKLDIEKTKDLLRRAELAFSPSSKFDLIVEYYISNGIFDIFEINLALFDHNQPLLGD